MFKTDEVREKQDTVQFQLSSNVNRTKVAGLLKMSDNLEMGGWRGWGQNKLQMKWKCSISTNLVY
jgi:hypothetical protein